MKTNLIITLICIAFCSCNRYFVTSVNVKNNMYNNADTSALLGSYDFSAYTMRNFVACKFTNNTNKVITIDWAKTLITYVGINNNYNVNNITPINEINVNPFVPTDDIAAYVRLLDKVNPTLAIAPNSKITVLLSNIFINRPLLKNFRTMPKIKQDINILIGYYNNNELLDLKYKSVTFTLALKKTTNKNIDIDDLHKNYNKDKNIIIF